MGLDILGVFFRREISQNLRTNATNNNIKTPTIENTNNKKNKYNIPLDKAGSRKSLFSLLYPFQHLALISCGHFHLSKVWY